MKVFFGKFAVLAGFLFLCANLNVSAHMVSFYVVEAGLPEYVENRHHSYIWENAFMDVFFDAGHIVCNAPILRLTARPSGDILSAVAFDALDAREGGIEYILIAMLDYTPDLLSADNITFYIYSLTSRKIVYEKKITGKEYRTPREESDDIKSIVRGLVPYVRN